MDVSVVVPIYTVEAYIERCLRSLFTQTKIDGVEFILVNDATPDDSMLIARRVIAEYPDIDVRIFEHSENMGVGVARQTGLDAAVGDYIIQVDSDDWCEPNMLDDMYAKAIEIDADVVYCDWYNDNDRMIHCKCSDNAESLHLFIKNHTVKNINLSLWNKLIRRNLFVENNINIDCGLRRMEDFCALIKILFFAKKVSYLPKAYYHYTLDNIYSIMNNLDQYKFSVVALFVQIIDAFFKENSCKLYEKDLLEQSVYWKLSTIRGCRGKRQKECLKYLPQVDEYILKGSHYPITTKIPYYLLIHKFSILANTIFNLSDLYHKLKR